MIIRKSALVHKTCVWWAQSIWTARGRNAWVSHMCRG